MLPADIQRTLRDSGVRKIFADGQIVQQSGDKADGFWLIEKGRVKIGNQDAEGDKHILYILGTGGSFGELACLGKFPRVADVEAIGPLETLWIGERIFSQVIAQSPEAGAALIRTLAAQLQEAVFGVMEMRSVPAPKRLVTRLMLLAAGAKEAIKLSIRQHELAELIGASRMTVAATLLEPEKEGLIERQYRYILLKDPDGLMEWMQR